jgi:AbrB family looped-hinge helix DNA binding protein
MADTRPTHVAGTRPRPRRPATLSTPIRTRGVVTLPRSVREQLQLAEGDNLIITVENGRIVMTPAAIVPRDQEWFWSPEWQAGEREADADLAAGRVSRQESDADFLDALGPAEVED